MSSFDPKVMRKNDLAVGLMYFIKTASKGIIGFIVGSAALTSDAFHSFSDLLQYILISWSTRIANRANTEKFPIGRRGLENFVATGIGFSLLFIGFWEFLIPGLHKSINIFGWVDWIKTTFLIDLKLEVVSQPSSSLPVVITFFATSIISYIVYKYEMRNAIILKSPAIKSDALELRSDLIVELVVAIGFLTSILWGFTWVDPIAQVIISGFIIHSGLDILKENGLKIQGMALPKAEQKQIREKLIMIEGVLTDYLDNSGTDFEVKAYYAGSDQVRVKCTLPIKSSSGQSIRLITSLAESRIKRLLEPTYGNIDVHIICKFIPSEEETDHLVGSIDHYLRTVWGIAAMSTDRVHILMRQFVTSQYETILSEAVIKASDISSTKNNQIFKIEMLVGYILAYCHFWLKGATNKDTESAYREIEDILKNKDLGNNIKSTLENAVAFYKIEKLIANGQSAHEEISKIRETLQIIYGNSLNVGYLRGEAAHLMAHSYYKVPGYDVDKARDWFKKAREAIISSGTHYISLFSDRIWTDWGNFEAQFHHLDEAEQYLNQALDIKQLQRDKHGLAIIYGCLANVAARKGEFLRAVELFDKDLQLVDELGIKKDKSHVQCKIADVLVKQAIINRDKSKAKDAVSVAFAANDGDPNAFFALKAIFKSHFTIWWLNPEDKDALREAGKTIIALIDSAGKSPSLYIKGILDRLQARYKAVTSDTEMALELFKNSQKSFTGIDSQADLPIQACLSNLEATRWSVLTNDITNWAISINGVLGELVEIMSASEFKLPKYITIPLPKEIKKLGKSLNKMSDKDIKNTNTLMKLNKQLERIDNIIWFLEL